jgi:Tol biopolymer transport system component
MAISPDGSRLAITTRDADGKYRLAVRQLDQKEYTPIAGVENPVSPFFSPDGQWIGYFGDGKLRKIPLQGGVPLTLCDADNYPSGSLG